MTKGIGIMTAVCLLSASAVAFGHHSFAAEFDASKPVTLVGNVTKVDWLNPHIWVYLDVKDKDGKVSNWQCEGGPPNTLTRNGWTKNALKQGDQITIDGTDIRTVTVESLRRNIGIVFQESFLFSNTIAANIAFGHPEATREQIERAARIAAAPSSGAAKFLRSPWNAPIGVRAAETMTTGSFSMRECSVTGCRDGALS